MEFKNIISIETSCDDSSIAVMSNNKIIHLSTLSSDKIQNTYGGVVPEVAAREHEKNIIKCLQEVLKDKKINIKDIDLIAYTNDPGLRVSLNVGEALATSLGLLLNKPLMPINHIHAHIFSFLYDYDYKDLEFPFLSLIVSGGHTSIYLVKSVNDIEVLNETRDDAVGEVFDKVARALNLGYPGGPAIDKKYDALKAIIKFSRNKNHINDEPFSFSGLKTSVLNYINTKAMKKEVIDVDTITSSFQHEIINTLIQKFQYYISKYKINTITLGGGVAANSLLQQKFRELNVKNIYIPKTKFICGDNGAMIAILANLKSIYGK